MFLSDNDYFLKKELIKLFKIYSIEYGNFIMSSGAQSTIYFDTSHVVQTSYGMNMVGQLISNMIIDIEKFKECRIDALGAVPLNGIPIALAGTFISKCSTIIIDPDGYSYRGFKSIPKGNIIIIEDVLQSGISVCKAIFNAQSFGYNVIAAICLIDREENGIQKVFEETNKIVYPIIKKNEII